jgi:hypothetical protein
MANFVHQQIWPQGCHQRYDGKGSWLCENSRPFSKVPENVEILRSLIELSYENRAMLR